MAQLPVTHLETHPDGTTGIAGIVNGNWERLEALFSPGLGNTDPSYNFLIKALTRNAAVTPGDGQVMAWDSVTGKLKFVNQGVASTPPVLTDYTWVNQSTRTATQIVAGVGGALRTGIVMTGPAGGVGAGGMLVKAMSGATNWSYRLRIEAFLRPVAFANCGLVLRDSVTGKLKTYSLRFDSVFRWEQIKYDSPTVFSALGPNLTIPQVMKWDVRLTKTGSNIVFEVSLDNGASWHVAVPSEALSTFVTPNQIGFYLESANSATSMLVTDVQET